MRKISLTEWAAIAEIVATAGLVVSLAFVAYSINQNTQVLQSTNDNFAYELLDSIYSEYATNETLASARVKLLNDEQLTPAEEVLYEWQLWRYFNLWEMAYDRHRDGLLSESKWNTWSEALEAEVTHPPLGLPKATWEEAGRVTYGDEFGRYIDAIYSNR